MDLNGFNAAAVDPAATYETLPAGWYKAVIIESEEKPTKAMTGSYLQMKLQVVEGDHQGRTLFERLNLNNPNAQAVEIAQRTLSAICHAVGVMTPRSSSDLHDKPLMVKVKVTPAKDGYEARNDIAGYEAAKAAGATAGQAQASGAKSPPWKR